MSFLSRSFCFDGRANLKSVWWPFGWRGSTRFLFFYFFLITFLRTTFLCTHLLSLYQVVCLCLFTMLCFVLIFWRRFHFRVHLKSFLFWFYAFDVFWFHFRQIELLWSKNRTRTSNTNPSNKWLSWNLIMFHCPKSYQSSSSS